ncbi:MAG TPA: PIN domain-containing protein [Kiritimatiellia bacterium]|nr:PIN domain-containing protein [Kiritimatiellia bacterium]HMO97506.1 PIN domain-containing protein [Kiritimatiellia bacterium]HMP97151.1 PIN domain-containing protein [Kiritimatiellia bacterium]
MILDTNALSALAGRDKALLALIRNAPRLHVTLISLGEFQFGLESSRMRNELEAWLKAFLTGAEVLTPGLPTLTHYAAIRRELKASATPIPANDVWIAALARQYKHPVVTRDRHFFHVKNLEVLSW